jgi:hypothetical protein
LLAIGAAISDPSFGTLVNKSIDDDWLSECVAGRKDIPERRLRELLSKASEIVRRRLITVNPQVSTIIHEILPASTPPTKNKMPGPLKDYRTAEDVVKSRELTEDVVHQFAKERKLEELMVSIAQLSGLSVYDVERLFMGTWTSPVAIILKAVGFHLRTADAIYHSRLSGGEAIGSDLIKIKAEFIAVRRPTAERILRFFCAKSAVAISNHSRGPSLMHPKEPS